MNKDCLYLHTWFKSEETLSKVIIQTFTYRTKYLKVNGYIKISRKWLISNQELENVLSNSLLINLKNLEKKRIMMRKREVIVKMKLTKQMMGYYNLSLL
jgi:hypothetical protein